MLFRSDPSQTVCQKINTALLSKGVIARAMPQGDILGFAPPFCLTYTQAEEIAVKVRSAIIEVLG